MLDGLCIDVLGRDLALGCLTRERLRSADELILPAVVGRDVEADARVVLHERFCLAHLALQALGHALHAADEADAHIVVVHLLELFEQVLREELHEELDLRTRALPVLCREGVDRQGLDAQIDGSLEDVLERLDARLVARRADEALALRPASIAIHDDGDVARQALPVDSIVERIYALRRFLFAGRASSAKYLFPHTISPS